MSIYVDETYKELIKAVLYSGTKVQTRNSKCLRVFGFPITFNACPLISLRKTSWKSAIREWEWFMSGSNKIRDLHESVHPWWKPWAVDGVVEYNYSKQFREFHGKEGCVDQVKELIYGIKNHPYSRRNVITTWNTSDMLNSKCAITNCHGTIIQAFVEPNNNTLHLVTYQRSADLICGVPHNWIQYWAFLLWLCQLTQRFTGSLVWIGGDVHIYEDHFELAQKMLCSDVSEINTPKLLMRAGSEDFVADNFYLDSEYCPLLTDKAKMVV